ncbi:uncharacterized protein LOC143073237 isoform X1 [Mytilus galloprovincialis]|uniref:uncharacterized protein LOC143073237 isoform X1 n=1 Tax=Mytilus galloprovincialis TaxID=29158 RepID=UPI003F7BCB57
MAANSSDTRNSTLVPSTAAKTTFLVIFLLVGLFGNLLLTITIGSNRKHRSIVINIITINLAITNLLNCFLNFSFAIGYTVSPSLDLDTSLCRVNSFFMNIVTIETPLTLTVFSLDRFIYSIVPEKYVSLQNIPRTIFMIIYTWLQSVAFSFPFIAGLISVEIYIYLSVCLQAEDINSQFLAFNVLLCYILPLCAMIFFFVFILKAACSQRDHIHTIMTQHQYSKDTDSDRNLYLTEVSATKTVGVLCLAWLICEMPFLSAFIARLTFKNIYYSPYANVTLLWLKFSYVMALPLTVFMFNKDIWQTFKDMMFCKKRNSVDDATNKEYSPDSSKDSLSDKLKLKVKLSDEIKVFKEEQVKENGVRNTGFQVPVFFATSHGVHMHTMDDDESLSDSDDVYDNPKVMKCDVLGSQEFLNQCDTSDYDSSNELDPFSVSHPITSKSVKDADDTLQRRSSSHPEVRMKSTDHAQTTVTPSSAADSGLDISTNKTGIAFLTTDTSKHMLDTHNEISELSQSSSASKNGLSIPGEIKESFSKVVLDSTPIQNDNETMLCSNSYTSDLESTITSISDSHSSKKKRKKKDKFSKSNTSEVSHTSSYMLSIKPPTRLQPLPNSPNHPKLEGGTLSNKLSLDILSAQQLCDTSVLTPSACHLVSDDLVNYVQSS